MFKTFLCENVKSRLWTISTGNKFIYILSQGAVMNASGRLPGLYRNITPVLLPAPAAPLCVLALAPGGGQPGHPEAPGS